MAFRVNIFRLKGVERELGRIADCLEALLAQSGVYLSTPKVDETGPAPYIAETDEERIALGEMLEELRGKHTQVEEDEEAGREEGASLSSDV